MLPALPRRVRLLLWAAASLVAAVVPAWLMPPARSPQQVRAEVTLPSLEHPEYVTDAGEYRPPVDAWKPAGALKKPADALKRSTTTPKTPEPAIRQVAATRVSQTPAVAKAAAPKTVPPARPAAARDPLVQSLAELSQRYWRQPSQRPAIQSQLDAVAEAVFFRPERHLLPPHTVQAGERLGPIAQRYGVSWGYLARLNRTAPERLRVGQRLKVHRGPFAAIVERDRFRVTVHSSGYYVASFPVAIGRAGKTPAGRFTVREKVRNPAWHGPDETIAADDPANPLGEHWIGLQAAAGMPAVSGLGMHGTINPASIGTAASGGCLRLHPTDVGELFDLLTPGSVVEIR